MITTDYIIENEDAESEIANLIGDYAERVYHHLKEHRPLLKSFTLTIPEYKLKITGSFHIVIEEDKDE